ncbi:MAG: hypothetical protein GY730_00005 [bacterium]|nr:hypothetical protein [bacterium]
MNKIYIVLLKNKYLLFSDKKPKKKGNYIQEVRLFKTDGNPTCLDVYEWMENGYTLPTIKEVEDWE